MQTLRPALFLDRDGVLIHDHGYIGRIDQVEIIHDIIPALQWVTQKEIPIIILTNQSGVARGMYELEDCHNVHQYIEQLLEELNIKITAWYICPHHPTKGKGEYLVECNCRKPAPGLALQAAEKYHINLSKSLMVGDKLSDELDLEELPTVLVRGRYKQKEVIPLEHSELLSYFKMYFGE